ncbi:41330_t:CDS:1, partial [Gigaspora margarita]
MHDLNKLMIEDYIKSQSKFKSLWKIFNETLIEKQFQSIEKFLNNIIVTVTIGSPMEVGFPNM